MNTIELIRRIDSFNFFKQTTPGLVLSVFLASLPEAVATVYMFASLFSLRGEDISTIGIGIGIVVSYVIYVEWAYGCSIQGFKFFSFIGTLFGGALAFGGWYIAFLQNGISSELEHVKFYVACVFVTGNAGLIAFLNDKIASKTKTVLNMAREEEKNLQDAFAQQRHREVLEHIQSLSQPKQPKRPVLNDGMGKKEIELILNKKYN